MTATKKKIDIPFYLPIPILLDEHLTVFKYSSYRRGNHAYKKILNWLVGGDSLISEPEESNEHNKCSVAIVFDDCLLKEVVGLGLLEEIDT